MEDSIRARVLSATSGLFRKTSETVAGDTPAWRAMSLTVVRSAHPRRQYRLSRSYDVPCRGPRRRRHEAASLRHHGSPFRPVEREFCRLELPHPRRDRGWRAGGGGLAALCPAEAFYDQRRRLRRVEPAAGLRSELNPDVKAAGRDPRKHYLEHGMLEGRAYEGGPSRH